MGKLILLLSLFGLGLLLILTLVAPGFSAVWLASTSLNFELLRAGLIILLLALLLTNPPRNVHFRAIVGLASLLLVGWCLVATYNNDMKLLDSMSLLMFSISAGITALERDLKEQPQVLIDRRTGAMV